MEHMRQDWPFDASAPRHAWTTITADGFPEPVPGCVYDGPRLDGGVPLGALGTGYFTLEGSGKIGFCSIYNDIVPPRSDFAEWLTLRVGQVTLPLSSAEIAYWGHYPFADLVAQFSEAPLTVGLRAFSPLIVGDAASSNIPAVLFELALSNHGTTELEVELSVAPPAPALAAHQATLRGSGITVHAAGPGVRGSQSVTIAPGQSQHVRFVFAWYAPHWRDSSREPHVHRYGTRYASADDVAEDALARFDTLRERTLAWQRVIYGSDLPGWLRDALVQGLYSLAKNSIWIARTRKDEWWSEDGWFAHSESHTGCPIAETMVCRMHGHFPVLFFFPELEVTTLDAFRHFQLADGEIPFCFGTPTSMRDPRYHCQHPLNSGQYAQMVYRLYLRTGDQEQLARFYDSAKRAIRYSQGLDVDGDGLVNDHSHAPPGEHWPANQFYDVWPWFGTSAYVAGTWLATLACGRAMAETMDDTAFAAECEDWLRRGLEAYHVKLWTGEYYRLWNDPENGQVSDVSLGNQLMAQWCTHVAGLPSLLPDENVRAALATVERLNMNATAYGLVNGVTPDGQRFDAGHDKLNDHAKQVFIGENLCAAMTFIYHGQDDLGLELARRMYAALALKSRAPWNQRCLIDAGSGLPIWGHDYYSNMVIWALPMALAHQGVGAVAEGDQLAGRMLRAARAEE